LAKRYVVRGVESGGAAAKVVSTVITREYASMSSLITTGASTPKQLGNSFLPHLLAVRLLVGNPEYFFCQTRASGGW